MILFWALIFPVGLLVVLGSSTSDKPKADLGGLPFIVVYTPVLMTFTLTLLALSAMPATLASYRDKGYLKRLSTTPVGAPRLLAAQLTIVSRPLDQRRDPDHAGLALRLQRAAAEPGHRLHARDRC